MTTEKIFLSQDNDVTLTTYLLEQSPEMSIMSEHPAILILPGGGYRYCSDREAEPVAMKFLAKGYNAFILRYSVGKEKAKFPRPLEDAECALEMIRGNAEKWNIDKNKIACIGFSAGGHLAAALATVGRIRPNAVILGYPCILSSISSILAVPVQSYDLTVTKETPPTFVFASADDAVVPIHHSLEFLSALDRAKVPFEAHIFGHGSHGFSVAEFMVGKNKKAYEENKHTAQWFNLCSDWLANLFLLEDFAKSED